MIKGILFFAAAFFVMNVAQAAEMEEWTGNIPSHYETPKFGLGPVIVKYARGEIKSDFELQTNLTAKAKSVLYSEKAIPLVKYLSSEIPISAGIQKEIVFEPGSLFYEVDKFQSKEYCYSPFVSPPPIRLEVGTHCLLYDSEIGQITTYKKYQNGPVGGALEEQGLDPIRANFVFKPLQMDLLSNKEKAPYILEKQIVLRKANKKKIEVGIADAMNSAMWFMGSELKPKLVKETKIEVSISSLPTTFEIGGVEIIVHSVEKGIVDYEIVSGFTPWAYIGAQKDLILIRGNDMRK